jgi:hypothetical protein
VPTALGHPTNEDLFAGTPVLHPTNEDLFAGTPVRATTSWCVYPVFWLGDGCGPPVGRDQDLLVLVAYSVRIKYGSAAGSLGWIPSATSLAWALSGSFGVTLTQCPVGPGNSMTFAVA